MLHVFPNTQVNYSKLKLILLQKHSSKVHIRCHVNNISLTQHFATSFNCQSEKKSQAIVPISTPTIGLVNQNAMHGQELCFAEEALFSILLDRKKTHFLVLTLQLLSVFLLLSLHLQAEPTTQRQHNPAKRHSGKCRT